MKSILLQIRMPAACAVACLLLAPPARAQTVPSTPAPVPFGIVMPRSHNPFAPYRGSTVPEPVLTNSPRLDTIIRDGKLFLSLKDAIALALENNLDLAIARYNLPIADTDVLRTRAGGFFRGVNAGVVQGTPGGGVGGLGAGAPSAGAGAGGTSGGAGGAGTGASGIVQSTLGAGTAVSSYDPTINAGLNTEHFAEPLSNLQLNGVPELQTNSVTGNVNYSQAFPTGTAMSFQFYGNRQVTNSIYSSLSPALNSTYRFSVQQQLLAGFGFGPNLRYLHIANNNRKITQIAFKDQVTSTVTQIANIYWDLVSAYKDEQVKERSLEFAQQTYENSKKQLELQAVPAMDVLKAEAEVANRDQDLTVAKTALQLQELLIKNALTRNLDDPILEEMPVVPTDSIASIEAVNKGPVQDLIAQALRDRPELSESVVDLDNRQISRKAATNALLPSLSLVGFYGGTGLAGEVNPAYTGEQISTVPTSFGGAVRTAFNNSAPDYLAGIQLSIPLRNRVAKADQFRSELEYKQAELRMVQLKKQIRIEVRNAEYALEQSRARVLSATKARDLAAKTFNIMKQEQLLGAGSNYQTLTAEHDLALAESILVAAETTYQKAVVEVDRATGATLETNGIQIQEALIGVVTNAGDKTSPTTTPHP